MNSANKQLKSPRSRAVCIGSVHWDWIGTTTIESCEDVPGIIERRPGGVAFNVAAGLNYNGVDAALLGAVGNDREGEELVRALNHMGLCTKFLLRIPELPTDRYLAIENRRGLVAAVADTRMLERAGIKILDFFRSADSLSTARTWAHTIVIDGNLTSIFLEALHDIQKSLGSKFAVVCASPGKASRISNFARIPNTTIYMNLFEAKRLLGRDCRNACDAAKLLCNFGFERVAVTNGPSPAAVATFGELIECRPPKVDAVRATGSGDAFAAAHIASELNGDSAEQSLKNAVLLASLFAAGELEY
ncbi:MAG: PfkB family carbohydrate kinase [Albidovulum sp.]|nr:PfkB family carbohydrate kinase [Albidovulum sp.]